VGPVTARTRPPESPELARARLRRGAGLDALVVLHAHRERADMTTRQITEQTQYDVRVIGAALGRARALGLVERRHVGGERRVRVWRITVTGCDFLRRTQGAR
jgi:DNA-binding MarR family transcriptional regulator